MASPATLWWSQPSPTSSTQTLELTPPPPLDATPPEPKPTPPAPNPKPNKNPKPSSSSAKKNPKRGPGLAQLERIRLMKIAGDEIHQIPAATPWIYEQEALVAGSSCPMHGGRGFPFAYATGAASCYVPAQHWVGCGHGGVPVSAIQSVLHEQYAMDRVRIGSGSVVLQPAELPSNHRPAAVCVVDHCEFCLRERRSLVREREIKEYEFFPHTSSSTESNRGVGLGLGGEHAAVSPPATSPDASNFVDLSLKLF